MTSLRSANIRDAQAILTILNQAIVERRNAYIDPIDLEGGIQWVQDMFNKSLKTTLVEVDDEVSAWGSLMPYRSGRGAFTGVYEIVFYVHADFRGQGVGRLLVSELEQSAKDRDVRDLIAVLLDDNTPSKALLEKNGFQTLAVFEGLAHFPDKDRGHLYMRKTLKY